jgi:lipoprotein-anchoring transpeptidase ErfK/SrfK
MRILAVAIALVLTAIPAQADVFITISKASQQMAVSVDGSAPMVWAVSTGRDGYNTPTGSFRAIRLEEVYFSKKYDDAPMPNSVFFLPGIAFHTGSLSVYSHGCIHLSAAASQKYFSTLQSGDVVQVVA